MGLLDDIHSPHDLRKLPESSLRQVADEVRDEILNVISAKGGHLASNLGSVELSVALCRMNDMEQLTEPPARVSSTPGRRRTPVPRETSGSSGIRVRGNRPMDLRPGST